MKSSKPQLSKADSPTLSANDNWALVSGDDKDIKQQSLFQQPQQQEITLLILVYI